MGFNKIQSYILSSEDGTSLRAAGWMPEAATSARAWQHTDGKPRRQDQPTESKIRYVKYLTINRKRV
jgi:hypothetical protein